MMFEPLQVQQMNFKRCLLPLKVNKSMYEETKVFSVHITKECWLTCLSHTRKYSVCLKVRFFRNSKRIAKVNPDIKLVILLV